ncbi:hypothetical protein DYBT9275_01353 [Dyadobacter sp. CECT 9275]|uniref:Outer membrane protein beta-barrel domain-containing protein n=1 Tax=Dyadobacter helix TaxID=2822344 RepID=A0A916J9Y3_9BACT|nr:hypothetical protein [Dyadobacter sp. CECT 9275]CAG4994252.1 hypothetical protein DYBT9275_01353 [Dyadobacter sp. CECT 9275]
MKIRIIFTALLLVVSLQFLQAQPDSTAKEYKTGFAVYIETGFLTNNSLSNIRKTLKTRNVDPFSISMTSLVLAKRYETKRWITESRLVFTNHGNMKNEIDTKRATLMGIGLGLITGPKIVNTSQWNVSIPVGLDVMAYRMTIKSNYSAGIAKVIDTPAAYQAVKLYTGSLNASVGAAVDYKTNFWKKKLDKFYISGKLSYQLPITTTGQWRGDNVQVNDMASFKPNQLYGQLGIILFPKL